MGDYSIHKETEQKWIAERITPEEFRRSSQALKTDLTLPGVASFKADTWKMILTETLEESGFLIKRTHNLLVNNYA